MDNSSSLQNRPYFLAFVFCLVTFSTILLAEDTFLFPTQEDGLFESAGALFFLTTSILHILVSIVKYNLSGYTAQDSTFFQNPLSVRICPFLFLFLRRIRWNATRFYSLLSYEICSPILRGLNWAESEAASPKGAGAQLVFQDWPEGVK